MRSRLCAAVTMLSLGTEFDRYRIDAELGVGGTGRVYKAFDVRLQRSVALKVLLAPEIPGWEEQRESSARMLREARAAAAFEHCRGKCEVPVPRPEVCQCAPGEEGNPLCNCR